MRFIVYSRNKVTTPLTTMKTTIYHMRVYCLTLLTPLTLVSVSTLSQADEYKNLSGAGSDKKTDSITFSGTQKWGKEFIPFTRLSTKYISRDWKQSFSVPKPPANSSARTKAELEYLQTVISKRGQHLSDIKKEVLVTNFNFGKHNYQTLTTNAKYTQTAKLLNATYHDMAAAVFHFKKKYNRVRPHILSGKLGTGLNTSIPSPGHPAYPSGHATGTYTIAFILQELDPANAKQYLADAKRIAENREIAGLHYPSDTEAGRLLARQIADSLLSNKTFQAQLKRAKAEW